MSNIEITIRSPFRDPHTQAFFEQMRACRDAYRRLAECIHAVVGGQEFALDIGCGIGLQTARLKELGWGIAGAEASPAAVAMREPGVDIMPFDLTQQPPQFPEPIYSCVICTETAEHIPEHFSSVIIDNVTALASEVIVWSAAAPGQEWEGHVNLQPPAYWITRFRVKGWAVDEARTAQLQHLMEITQAQHYLGRQNFFVFVKRSQPLHMTIVSTVLNGERWIGKCIESVHRQTFTNYRHLIIDAKSSDDTVEEAIEMASDLAAGTTHVVVNDERKSALQNCWEAWGPLPDDEVIVWLDGDDWLAHDRALEIVAHAYASPEEPWLTYGQFMFTDGEVGFASPYPPGVNVRWDAWRATHLKTFRAGLVKNINPADLMRGPDWCEHAIDKAVMWPLLEMAGARYTCIYQVVSVYNMTANSASRPKAEREFELAEVERMRRLKPYELLKDRPWPNKEPWSPIWVKSS